MPKGLRRPRVTFDEPNLTHFGGMLPIHRFCKQLRLKRLLQKHVPFQHERVNRDHPADLLLAILSTMIAGIPRLSKTRLLQYNGCSQHLLGLRGFPDPTRLRRWLLQLSPEALEGINTVHEWLRLQLFSAPRPLPLQQGELPHVANRLLFCVLPHRAGVEQNHIGALRLLGDLIALAGEHPKHFLSENGATTFSPSGPQAAHPSPAAASSGSRSLE